MWDWLILDGTGVSLIAIALILYVFFKPFNYWKKMDIPYLKPRFPGIGSLDVLLLNAEELGNKLMDAFPNERFFGIFKLWQPCLVIKDPELIEKVLVSDFSHFYNRDIQMDVHTCYLVKHVANVTDEYWKALRAKLTPTFSTGKLKNMQSQLNSCADNLVKYFSNANTKEFDMKDISGRFAIDVIATCAFGMDVDLINNPEHKFREVALSMFVSNYFNKFFWTHMKIIDPIFKLFRLEVIPKKLAKFFADAVDHTIEYRMKNNVTRQDFLHLLHELKLRDDEMLKRKEISENDPGVFDHRALVSNAFVFLAAGYDTTASLLSFLFRELALHPHIQDKLYEEVVRVIKKYNGELSYEAISEMTYMDQVIAETLRMHSPLAFIDRAVTKDYVIPGTDKVLPAGAKVMIPVWGLHHHPQYYPQPDKFIPERFDAEKNSITRGTYLAFGMGPRTCIAMRFAKCEAKTCAAKVLSVFKLIPSPKTKPVMEYDRTTFLTSSKDIIWVSLEKRTAPVVQPAV